MERSLPESKVESVEPLAIARRFEVGACAGPVVRLGEGHIHETFLVGDAGGPRFVLQRINEYVFADADALVANLDRVTHHVREQLRRRNVQDLDRRCLRVTPARDGRRAIRDDAGRLWRCTPYIEGTRSLDRVPDRETGFATARAFGEFIGQLADLPVAEVRDTIPHFHDLARRISGLEAAAREDSEGRAEAVAADTAAVLDAGQRIESALAAAGATRLPRRVVHNDCKINNLLLDAAAGQPLCVVDLDTVMEGTLLADFGELVRTSVCNAAEDETHLERIQVAEDVYRGVAEGFVAGLATLLQDDEAAALPLAGPTLALENAVRFLTDYLTGDRYFRTRRPEHNLDRTRAQLRVAERLLAARGVAQDFIDGARR